jgi:hypothetical protein
MSTPTEPDRVRAEVLLLARGRRRVRFVKVFGWLALGGLTCIAIAAWFVTWQQVLLAGCLVLAAAALLALAAAALVPVDPVVVAKHYDDRIGARDLVSSSLELAGDPGRFATAVREDALAATGRASARELYPLRMTRELRWLPLPVAAAALAIFIDLSNAPMLAPPNPDLAPILRSGADEIEKILQQREDQLALAERSQLDRIKELANRLRDPDLDKRQSLAEVAKLASQLDKERKQLESEKLKVEKNAAKLARGEDVADAQRDMDAGRYREAAHLVKKKIEKLEKELEEAQRKPQGKIEIEKLKDRIAKLKTLLAELERLDALGRDMGFLVEVLEALERIEGRLGELGEYDGDLFEDAQLGRLRRPRKADEIEPGDRLLVMPSNEAGKGHVKKFLGDSQRALTESHEREAKLRESKGKSAFGQVRTANDGSRSQQAYDEAFLAARRAAEDAVYRQNIPAGYRKYIRSYFEIMQPDTPPAAAEEDTERGK